MSEQYREDRALDAGVVYPMLQIRLNIVVNEGNFIDTYLLLDRGGVKVRFDEKKIQIFN